MRWLSAWRECRKARLAREVTHRLCIWLVHCQRTSLMQLLRFIVGALLIGGGVLTDSALAARAKKKAAAKPAAATASPKSTSTKVSTTKAKTTKSATAGPPAPRVRTV